MHYLSEENILVFLLQVAVLLGLARALGEVFRRWGQPSITAEILVGVVLGPTVLARALPTLHAALFPPDAAQQNMLDTVAWLGILLFLLKAGLETNLATAWRQKGAASVISLSDLVVPMVIAFVPALLLPASWAGEGAQRGVFALFIATIMTISALPVTARVLQDLRVYRTDLGLLIMSALTINDVAGWVVFALILGLFTEAAISVWSIGVIVVGTGVFSVVALALGPRAFDASLRGLQRARVPEPAGSLTLVVVLGLLCGAVTTWIGIHALFGFFVAGILAGEAQGLSERTRNVFSQMVHAILVPLFFASIGLKIDFFAHFRLAPVLFMLAVGVTGRFVGAWLGARLTRQPPVHRQFIAAAHVPGGEMQIVIGILALEYGVISEPIFVAIILGAVVSTVIAGPWMNRILQRVQRVDWLAYLPVDGIAADLHATQRDPAIAELARLAARQEQMPPSEELQHAAIHREHAMSTALGEGLAVPHARLRSLERPLVVFGRSESGIDWNSPDGVPVRLIFLVLTPDDRPDVQLTVLQGIAQVAGDAQTRDALRSAPTAPELLHALRRAATIAERPEPRRRRRGRRT